MKNSTSAQFQIFPRCIRKSLFNSPLFLALVISFLIAPGVYSAWVESVPGVRWEATYPGQTGATRIDFFGGVWYTLVDGVPFTGQAGINAAYAVDSSNWNDLWSGLLSSSGMSNPAGGGGGGATLDASSQALLDTVSTAKYFGTVVLIVLAAVSICLAIGAAVKNTFERG